MAACVLGLEIGEAGAQRIAAHSVVGFLQPALDHAALFAETGKPSPASYFAAIVEILRNERIERVGRDLRLLVREAEPQDGGLGR